MEIKSNSTRIINGMEHQITTVDGLDRCQINTRLHYLSEEMYKLKAKQARFVQMRDMLDRECDRMERAQDCEDLFAEMFGG